MNGAPVWRTGDGPSRAPLSGTVEADLCVVGLGGSGLSAVAEAVRLGRSVVGLDAGEVACAAAGRNGGFLLAGTPDFHHRAVAALGRSRAAAIYRLTLAEIDRMERGHPGLVRRAGSLRIADDADADEHEDCAAMLEALRADGFEAEWYDGPEGAGVLLPADGAFDPLDRCRREAAALTGPAALHEHSPATRLSAHAVETPSGRVECGAVVVCVDGGLERVLPELAEAGRVRTARLQMLATAPLPPVAPRPVYARWGFDYWQQLPSGAVALGGCRDRFLDDEWTTDAVPTEPVQACLDRLLAERLHLPHAVVTHRWAGCVGFTPDHMPVLAEARPGVVAAGGYCGTGNVLGALCGRAAVRLALGLPLAELEPLQEPGPAPDRTLHAAGDRP